MNLRRFVTYIYRYEQGKRGKNAGFIKVDTRDGGCRMEIQVREQERMSGKGKIYLIVSGEGVPAVPAGEMVFGAGGGRAKLFFGRNRLGESGYTADQIQAVVVRGEGGKLFVSCWAEQVPEAVLYGRFRILGEAGGKEQKPEAGGEQQRPEKPQDQTPAAPEEIPVRREEVSDMDGGLREGIAGGIERSRQEETVDEMGRGRQEETVDEMQRGRQEEMVDEMQGGRREEAGDDMEGSRQEEAADDMERELRAESLGEKKSALRTDYRKIEITDIRKLPKSNWHLCSNSFLIHGFFNYHYLMLKTVEQDGQKTCWLGVPGVYEQPERMMALMFGFPEFEPAGQEQQRPEYAAGNAGSEAGVFGFWMCRLTC